MNQKVVIIGAGSVGATYAYALMQAGIAREIVLIDRDLERAQGEAMDLQQGMAFTPAVRLVAGGFEECSDADLVVVTAGAKQRPGETRMELAGRNAAICQQLLPQILGRGFHGVLLMVSNPVDVLTQFMWKRSGLPRHQVIGSGTVLDSARLRALLAEHCGVDARNIHALVVGEHGDSEVAAWSAATIGGVPIQEYCQACGACPAGMRYPELLEQVKRSAYEIIRRKGATFYAIGLSLLQITAAILRDEHRVLPISTVLEEFQGIRDVALSLPTIVGQKGVEKVLTLKLDPEETEAMKRSALVIKTNVELIEKSV